MADPLRDVTFRVLAHGTAEILQCQCEELGPRQLTSLLQGQRPLKVSKDRSSVNELQVASCACQKDIWL